MSIFRPYKYKDKEDLKKDAPAKHPAIVFFEIYFRKFWRFLSVNFIYFLVCLPLLINFYFMANTALMGIGAEYGGVFPALGIFAALLSILPESAVSSVFYVLLAVSALLYGPAKMGVSYVYRNFARQEHAWFSDVFARARANWKQGVFFGLLDLLVIFLLIQNLSADRSLAQGTMETLLMAGQVVTVVVMILYAFMRHYFYLMAVTVELSVFVIIKNSVLLSIVGLWRNLLTTVICLVLWFAALALSPVASLFILPFIIYSLCGFVTAYTCYPLIHRHIVAPALENDDTAHEGYRQD